VPKKFAAIKKEGRSEICSQGSWYRRDHRGPNFRCGIRSYTSRRSWSAQTFYKWPDL